MEPVSFQDILDRLRACPREVAERYAPGGHVEGGKYWALCPWRADRHVGSFYVNLAGPYAGRWADHAADPSSGDMLDLIQMSLRTDRKGALTEARAFLGMADETPKQRRLRARQAEKAKAQAKRDRSLAEADEKKRRARAQALFLRSHERLDGTPVAGYLRARAIGLERLGRIPHTLRYHPDLPYRHTDRATGEVIEGAWPALVAAAYGPAIDGARAEFYGAHRIWLARRPDGAWGKAPVPAAKKYYGTLKGAYIRLWSGHGPRGGKGPRLAASRDGRRAWVCEGIEDGLSAAVIHPDALVLCAITLGNIREMVLPAAIAHVTIIADNDPAPEQTRQIERAMLRFSREGRRVDAWHNDWGGKDLNDALMGSAEVVGAA